MLSKPLTLAILVNNQRHRYQTSLKIQYRLRLDTQPQGWNNGNSGPNETSDFSNDIPRFTRSVFPLTFERFNDDNYWFSSNSGRKIEEGAQ